MDSCSVSIVVPCYKKAKFLADALNSILSQTYKTWECVIVNDGSPDNTEEVALEFCRKDRRFHYLAQPNLGVSAARNNGIRRMSGKYILALDADDWISDTYIEKAVHILEENPSIKLVYSRYELFNKDQRLEWNLPAYSYDRFVMGDSIIVCSAVYRRSDFDRVGGYDETMQGFEDWDLWLSIIDKDDIVHRIDEILFHYRNGSSIVSQQVSNNFQAHCRKLCQKHSNIYMSLYTDVLFYYHYVKESKELKDQLQQVQKVYNSYAYRLGKFLLKPFSKLRKSSHDLNHHLFQEK